ncbi:MAG TPA: rhodanese-like domain-containing protein [Anaerolineales bacterium]|nr:rhodanese-like domain-containing protein [Anaerolineales bacterium]
MPAGKSSTHKKAQQKAARPRWIVWTVIGLLVLIAAGAYAIDRVSHKTAQIPTPTPTTTLPAKISVNDAYYLFENNSAFFIDLRPSTDWASYHIDKSISIPADQLAARLSDVPKTGVIILVDDSGEMSFQYRDILLKAGYTAVTSMTGGMNAWVQSGLPFIGTAPY